MPNAKKKENLKTTNAPENLDGCTFFKRLGFKLSEEQKVFRDAIYNKENDIVIVNSRAGTGKTTIAIATACCMIEFGLYDKILYCFSLNNGFQNSLGLLPGDQKEKEIGFFEPATEALIECGYQPEKCVKELLPEGASDDCAFVSCMSHTFLRGTNIDERTILIIDEAENFYFDELKKVLTRVKNGCKVIMIGHTGQCDIISHPERAGFEAYVDCFSDFDWAQYCELTENHRGRLSRTADDFNFELWKEKKENGE